MAPDSIPQPEPSVEAEPEAGDGVMSAWRFRLAVLMHDRAVYRVAAGILRDAREAEDVTQEVFLSYWQHGARVERPREWLLRVARNACMSRFRRSGRVVHFDLGPDMMRFFGEAAKQSVQATTGLEGVTNVRVRVYEGIGDSEADLVKFVDDTSRTLAGAGWSSVVRVNEDGERVRIFMKPSAGGANTGSIEGITLMVVDTGGGDEAVFINIAGDIRPEQLGRIAAGIGMDGMFDMMPAFPGPGGAAQKAPQD